MSIECHVKTDVRGIYVSELCVCVKIEPVRRWFQLKSKGFDRFSIGWWFKSFIIDNKLNVNLHYQRLRIYVNWIILPGAHRQVAYGLTFHHSIQFWKNTIQKKLFNFHLVSIWHLLLLLFFLVQSLTSARTLFSLFVVISFCHIECLLIIPCMVAIYASWHSKHDLYIWLWLRPLTHTHTDLMNLLVD